MLLVLLLLQMRGVLRVSVRRLLRLRRREERKDNRNEIDDTPYEDTASNNSRCNCILADGSEQQRSQIGGTPRKFAGKQDLAMRKRKSIEANKQTLSSIN